MINFRNLSLRSKQTLIMMLTSSAVLLLAGAAFVTYDAVNFRRQLSQRRLAVRPYVSRRKIQAAQSLSGIASRESAVGSGN